MTAEIPKNPATPQDVLDEEPGLGREAIQSRLLEQVPELFEGQVPGYFTDRMNGQPYALGTHQGGPNSIQDARELMQRWHGITGATRPGSRFRILGNPTDPNERNDPEYIRHLNDSYIVDGYYGLGKGGRFVYAFPVSGGELDDVGGNPRIAVQSYAWYGYTDDGKHLRDIYHENLPGEPVNPKYCVGFIDESGEFHPNAAFMQGDAFEPSTPELLQQQDD